MSNTNDFPEPPSKRVPYGSFRLWYVGSIRVVLTSMRQYGLETLA